MADRIVLRTSPDWLRFDAQSSLAFCIRHHLPESTVVDFIALWDTNFSVPYRDFREALKQISLRSFRRVSGAEMITLDALEETIGAGDEALHIFIDDDDWLAPEVFRRLRDPGGLQGGQRARLESDGALWGSVFLGKVVGDTPMEKAGGAVLQKRAFSDIVYTNNYAVSGLALKRLGIPAVSEHASAHHQLHEGAWTPARPQAYLSLANKHPCCTVMAHFNMQSEGFRRDPVGVVTAFRNELGRVRLDGQTRWTAPYLSRFTRLIEDAVRPRRRWLHR